jgi:cyclophilin family peptidyl-prolyl cis-trans isomerase
MKVLYLILAITFVSLVACNKAENEDNKNLAHQDKQEVKSDNSADKDISSKKVDYPATPVITHYAYIKTTAGKITLGLYGDDAPETVANFIGLSKMKYYNGVLIHRVARSFLIQMGDKLTRTSLEKKEWGTGGETFNGGELLDELNPETPSYKEGYKIGVVAMANKGPHTGTSQFFICLDEAKFLKHDFPIFGRVVEGIDLVQRISEVEIEPTKRDKYDGIPIKPIRILSIKINLIKAPQK